MLAGNLPLNTIIIPETCTCEFTAVGQIDVDYPAHFIFKHTKTCRNKVCHWRGIQELWFFDDSDINRAGNIKFSIKQDR